MTALAVVPQPGCECWQFGSGNNCYCGPQAAVPQPGDPHARPRCYRLAPIYRTVCGQWSDAETLTDWSAVTCPECRRRGLREVGRD